MAKDASIEEAEDTPRMSELIRRRRHWCVYRQLKVLTTSTKVSIEEAEDTTCLSERLKLQRRQCVYGLRLLTTMTAALVE